MSDSRLRRLEVIARTSNTTEDWSRYYREATRMGSLTPKEEWELGVAAFLGHPVVDGWAEYPNSICNVLQKVAIQNIEGLGPIINSHLYHDVADVWAAGLDEPYNRPGHPLKPKLVEKAMTIGLTMMADHLYDNGWPDHHYISFKGLIQDLPVDAKFLQTPPVAAHAESLIFDFEINPDYANIMWAYVAALDSYADPLFGSRTAFEHMLLFFTPSSYRPEEVVGASPVRFCKQFGKELGDWVLGI
jgi:hypothetical protein